MQTIVLPYFPFPVRRVTTTFIIHNFKCLWLLLTSLPTSTASLLNYNTSSFTKVQIPLCHTSLTNHTSIPNHSQPINFTVLWPYKQILLHHCFIQYKLQQHSTLNTVREATTHNSSSLTIILPIPHWLPTDNHHSAYQKSRNS